ncbi:MAG: hypothetical protein U9Q81_03020 [Pseudomonadota bacterium]|nr:hypothetical protein [Pseudomonadota bacterium]
MEAIKQLRQLVSQTLEAMATGDLAAQIAVLTLATAIALVLRARWSRRLDALLERPSGHKYTPLVLRGSRRLVFPLSLALIALFAHAVFDDLGLATGLFDLAVPLMVVLATVRTLVFLLRVAAGPDVRLPGWELFISILLWGIGVLYLLGWLPAVEHALDSVALSIGTVRISLLGTTKFVVLSTLLVLASLAARQGSAKHEARSPR